MNASATHCLLGQGWWLLLRVTPKARSVLPWPSRLHRCCMTPLTPAMPPAIAATGFGFCRQLPLLVLCYSHLSEITETPICHLSGPPSGLLSPLCFHPSDHLLSCCCIFCSMPISRSLKYPRSPCSRHIPISIQNVLPGTALGFHSLPRCTSQLTFMSALPCQHIFSNIWQILHRFTPSSPSGGSCLLL